MKRDRWLDIKEKIRDKFSIAEQETLPLDPGPGTVERLVFRTPAGTMKLEFRVKPRMMAERGMGSRRIGGSVAIEREYSDTEEICTLTVFQQSSDGQWTELSPEAIP